MASPNWHIFDGLTGYEAAQQIMREHQQQLIASEGGTEQIMLLSHPPLYTAGTSARPEDLLARQKAELSEIEIFENTGRGGQWTYHGPGQRIVWPVLDLNRRTPDIRLYVHHLEGWIMDTLASFGIDTERREALPGLWVRRHDIRQPDQLDKIAAIGVRVSKWVTMHGVAVNLDPDLSHYDGIIACGVTDGGVTSAAELGHLIPQAEFDMALKACFEAHFGDGAQMGIR